MIDHRCQEDIKTIQISDGRSQILDLRKTLRQYRSQMVDSKSKGILEWRRDNAGKKGFDKLSIFFAFVTLFV